MKKIRLIESIYSEIKYSENYLVFNPYAISFIEEKPNQIIPFSDNYIDISTIHFTGSDKSFLVLTEELNQLTGLKGYKD